MSKFLITGNNFFNKLALWSLFIFIGFCLGNIAGCAPRNHLQVDLSDSNPSNATIEYNNALAFKAKHKAFYSQFKN
jgi:hypothetical protein